MKHGWVFALLLALATFTLTAPAAAQETPDACTGNVTNATNQTLCDRIDRLQDTNDNLRANVTSLRGEVEKLEYELENSESAQSLAQNMGFIYKDGNPQVLLLRLEKENAQQPNKKYGIFQKCVPSAMDRAGYDFNNDGVKEYCEVPIDQVGDSALAPIKIELYYAEAGMNTTHVLDQSNAEAALRDLQERLNDHGGIAAYDEWKTQKLNTATSQSFRSTIGIGVAGAGVGAIGILFAVPVARRVQGRRRATKSYRTGAQSGDQTWRDRLTRLINWIRR